MFLSEQQARARLANPENLARRFDINGARRKCQAWGESVSSDRERSEREEVQNAEGRLRGEAAEETEESESGTEIEEPEGLLALPADPDGEAEHGSYGITHTSIPRPGRCGPRLSVEKRTEIAIAAATSGLGGETRETHREIAQRFGISRQGVSDINSGLGRVNQAAIDEALEAARNKALDKLMLSLGLLTEEKIEPLKAKDLASVANSMANVVMKTLPQASPQGQINLVIYSPEIRSEKAFEVIEI